MSNRHGTHSDYEYSALLRDDPDWDGKATSDSAEKHLTGAVSAKVLKRYSMAFAVTTFGIGPAFGSAVTYMSYQIQQDAFHGVGHHPGMPNGSGCPDLGKACRVPLGSKDVNLTSLLLYLNAISYCVSGLLTLLVCGWGDHINYKREQYIGALLVYGSLCLPVAGLTHHTLRDYSFLIAIYTIFNIVGFLGMAYMNIFIPYAMHASTDEVSDVTKADDLEETSDDLNNGLRARQETEGLKMSVWGGVSMNVGLILFYGVTVALSRTSDNAKANAGLYMTTAAGVVCIACALAGWKYLPNPAGKPYEGSFWLLPFRTFRQLWRGLSKYRNAMLFLLSFAIYSDSVFAFGTVIGNLFNLSVRPSMMEFTAYSVTGTATSIIGSLSFMWLFPRVGLSLKKWALISYATVAFCALWCCLGMTSLPIGFKHRGEFYIFQVIQQLAGSIISPLFRVLFAEMFPKGNEIQYFGFQLVITCATTWVPQLVNGPLVDKTNNQRLPAVVSMAFFGLTLWLTWICDDDEGIAIIREEELVSAEAELERF